MTQLPQYYIRGSCHHQMENINHEKLGKRGKTWENVGKRICENIRNKGITREAVAEGIQDSRNFSVEVLFTVGK